jgi:hypothetical protein
VAATSCCTTQPPQPTGQGQPFACCCTDPACCLPFPLSGGGLPSEARLAAPLLCPPENLRRVRRECGGGRCIALPAGSSLCTTNLPSCLCWDCKCQDFPNNVHATPNPGASADVKLPPPAAAAPDDAAAVPAARLQRPTPGLMPSPTAAARCPSASSAPSWSRWQTLRAPGAPAVAAWSRGMTGTAAGLASGRGRRQGAAAAPVDRAAAAAAAATLPAPEAPACGSPLNCHLLILAAPCRLPAIGSSGSCSSGGRRQQRQAQPQLYGPARSGLHQPAMTWRHCQQQQQLQRRLQPVLHGCRKPGT